MWDLGNLKLLCRKWTGMDRSVGSYAFGRFFSRIWLYSFEFYVEMEEKSTIEI